MLNVHVKEIITIVIIYLFIIQILRLFILSRIKSENSKKKSKVSKDLYINNNYVSKESNDKSSLIEDVTQEFKKYNSSVNFIESEDITEEIKGDNISNNSEVNKNITKAIEKDKYVTKQISDKSLLVEDVTEEIKKDNLNDEFRMKKNILVIHSKVTI